MTIEIPILASILDSRSIYETFTGLGDVESFSPLGKLLVGAVGEYYKLDANVQSCDRDVVCERIIRGLPNPKHQTTFREFMCSLPRDVSAPNVTFEIRELRRQHVGQKLSLALANRSDAGIVSGLLEEYRNLVDGHGDNQSDSKPELINVLDTEDLSHAVDDSEGRIKLFPKALNDRCAGGARAGHHILLFARPENGKTAFAINLCAGFLKQGLSVLYVGNEEPAEDIRDRVRARLLKIPRETLNANRDRAASALKALGGAAFIVAPMHPGSPQQISKLLESRPFQVLVIDQLRNLSVKADTKVGELETAAKEARALGKKHNVLVVSITQAGDSATNKVYLGMSDVDSSKTGIPAAVDVMIGLGSDDGMKLNNLMGISLPKNKLSGNHESFTVSVDFSTGVIV